MSDWRPITDFPAERERMLADIATTRVAIHASVAAEFDRVVREAGSVTGVPLFARKRFLEELASKNRQAHLHLDAFLDRKTLEAEALLERVASGTSIH